jgi:hypothetical protein
LLLLRYSASARWPRGTLDEIREGILVAVHDAAEPIGMQIVLALAGLAFLT